MLCDNIGNIEKIIEYLDENSCRVQINRIKYALDNSEYALCVMGQFSAGKSMLINNLLDKHILPVHITETTALITFIRYSEYDKCVVTCKDEYDKEISIEESLSLWQSGDLNKFGNIEFITFYVNSELLKNGLVIIDTPGINTTIKKHAALASQIFERSDKIVYVLRKPLTYEDSKFLDNIAAHNIPIMLVRTHMDEIKKTEETYEKTIEKEYTDLSVYSDKIFFVSNQKENMFYNKISELYTYIFDTLSVDVKGNVEESCNQKIYIMADTLNKKLNEKRIQISLILSGEREKFEKEKAVFEKSRERLQYTLESKKINLNSKYDNLKKEAVYLLSDVKKSILKKTAINIQDLPLGSDKNLYDQYMEKCIRESFYSMQNVYVECFETMIEDNNEELYKDLYNYSEVIDFDGILPESLLEADEQNDMLLGKIKAMQAAVEEIDAELSRIAERADESKEEKAKATKELALLAKNKAEIINELNNYPEYEKQYIYVSNEDTAVSDSLRKIGSMLDWATILIPGKVYVTGASKVLNGLGTIAKTLPKGAELAVLLGKLSKTLNSTKKIKVAAKVVDSALDTVKVVKKATREEKPNLLDFFTIEYYMGRIGSSFDKPPVVEIDKEYENQYHEKKKEIESRVRESVNREISRQEHRFGFESEAKKLASEMEVYERKSKEANAELEKLKIKLESERRASIIKLYKKSLISKLEENLNKLEEIILTDISKHIDNAVSSYIGTYNSNIISKINETANKLNSLEYEFNNADKKKLQNDAEVCTNYLAVLNKIIKE